jgi:hypothetical protein
MHDLTCLIKGCQARVYAPAGTHSICREHFLGYLTWRRRKGPQMFMKYAGMTMEERDPPRRRMGQHHSRRRSPHRLSAKILSPTPSRKKTLPATLFLPQQPPKTARWNEWLCV